MDFSAQKINLKSTFWHENSTFIIKIPLFSPIFGAKIQNWAEEKFFTKLNFWSNKWNLEQCDVVKSLTLIFCAVRAPIFNIVILGVDIDKLSFSQGFLISRFCALIVGGTRKRRHQCYHHGKWPGSALKRMRNVDPEVFQKPM